jgi:hypothetical protein
MNAPQPDIQPDDLQFILTTLRREFPTSEVDYIPKPDSIAALFRVIERSGIQHQLRAPRRVLDDARLKPGQLRSLLTRAVAQMRRVGPEDVVELGA